MSSDFTTIMDRIITIYTHSQARTIYGINLDELELKKFAGTDKVPPAGDLSGQWWDEEKQEMK